LSVLINSLKDVSSRKLRQKFKVFQKEYWGEDVALWSRSYFVASVGGATLDVLKEYEEFWLFVVKTKISFTEFFISTIFFIFSNKINNQTCCLLF
jgi:hypothetical protein